MRQIHFILIALLLFGITTASSARDLPHTDPERKAILDATRSDPAVRFVVKDLYRSGDFAWLCAQDSVDGAITRVGEAIQVKAFILFRDKGVWFSVDVWHGWFNRGEKALADCSSAFDSINGAIPLDQFNIVVPPVSEEDIKTLWQIAGRSAIMDYIGLRKREGANVLGTIAMLKQHGILEDFVIDYPKGEVGHGDIDAAMKRCKDASCRKVMTQAAADISRQRGDNRVSSLVWDNCQYGVRIQRMDSITNCIGTHMLKPYCRSGMHYFQDKEDIQRCLGDIAKQCRSLSFEDDRDRSAYCSDILLPK